MAQSGEPGWHYRSAAPELIAAPELGAGGTLLVAAPRQLSVLRAASGALLWSATLPCASALSLPLPPSNLG